MTKTNAMTAGMEKAMIVGMIMAVLVPDPSVFWYATMAMAPVDARFSPSMCVVRIRR